MNSQDVLWFVAGMLTAVAATFVIYPRLREHPRAPRWAALPKGVFASAALILAVAFDLYLWLASPQRTTSPSVASTSTAGAITAHANNSSRSAAAMDSVVAGLESRLAQGGGSDADWDLLAKSYEFMGRLEDAAAAERELLFA
jgi:cytochrome c-type biogenesis protein CcmH/NrfG